MYCQLQKNGFSVCFFHSNRVDKRASLQTDQAVSEGLCCSKKNTSKGIGAPNPRLLPPSWAEKKDSSTSEETSGMVTWSC